MKLIPRIAFSIGDTAGIGPEITLRSLGEGGFDCIPIVYAEFSMLQGLKADLGLSNSTVQVVSAPEDALENTINVIQVWDTSSTIISGQPTEESGRQSFLSLNRAAKDLKEGRVDALVTAPIDKQNIQNESFSFPGHTEFLADLSDTKDYLMLLVSGPLRVGVVTGHIPVQEIATQVTSDKILSKLRVIQKSLVQDFGIEQPKIAVLGLNPHAGDKGLIGQEEQTIIIPAIQSAQELGINAHGPFPADGLFGSAGYKEFDAILGMYHDQGLVPFKALSFGSGVNFTAGLPIVRTSPDHGTAYDIVGQGIADPQSFRNAVYAALDIYRNRENHADMTSNRLKKKSGHLTKSER